MVSVPVYRDTGKRFPRLSAPSGAGEKTLVSSSATRRAVVSAGSRQSERRCPARTSHACYRTVFAGPAAVLFSCSIELRIGKVFPGYSYGCSPTRSMSASGVGERGYSEDTERRAPRFATSVMRPQGRRSGWQPVVDSGRTGSNRQHSAWKADRVRFKKRHKRRQSNSLRAPMIPPIPPLTRLLTPQTQKPITRHPSRGRCVTT